MLDVGGSTEGRLPGLVIGREYFVAVTAYDELGLESEPSEELNFVFEPPNGGELIRIEAESGDPEAPMEKRSDADGSWLQAEGEDFEGSVALDFDVPADGRYEIWCRVRSTTGAPALFSVRLSEPPQEGMVDLGAEASTGWEWVKVGLVKGEGSFSMVQGPSRVVFDVIAAGAALDFVVITSDPDFVPDDEMPRSGSAVEFTAHPEPAVVVAGDSVELRGRVLASGTVSYQWYRDGMPIDGATDRTLEFTGVESIDGGEYWLEASVGDVVETTEPVQLIVLAEGVRISSFRRRSVNGEPFVELGIEGLAGQEVHVLASNDMQDWEVIGTHAGGPGLALILDPESAVADQRFYRAMTAPAAVAINGPVFSHALQVGGDARFAVEARANGPVEYQWYGNGLAIDGATGPVLDLADVGVGDAGEYWVRISSGDASVVSEPARLVVASGLVQISSFERLVGEKVALRFGIEGYLGQRIHVFASDDMRNWTWLDDPQNVGGFVTVTDLDAASSVRRFYKVAVSAAISIDAPVFSQASRAGGDASFAVEATADGPVEYQWFRNGSAIDGATGAVLDLTGVGAGDAGEYSVRISSGDASVVSESARLVVASRPAKISSFERLTGGEMAVRLGLENSIGQRIHVLASDDMRNWTWLGDPLNVSGFVTVADPDGADSGSRFYQVAVPNSK